MFIRDRHCSKKNTRRLGDVGQRFLDRTYPGLEAQLANVADEIAYNNHDVDDGLRAGLLTEDELAQIPLFGDNYRRIVDATTQAGDKISRRRMIHETVRAMVNEVVTDLVECSRAALLESQLAGIDAVRTAGRSFIDMSPETRERHRALKRFLHDALYRHERVQAMTRKADEIVTRLFELYMNDVRAMPTDHSRRALEWHGELGDAGRARAVADYVAGMTDRYAYSAYRRYTGAETDADDTGITL